MPGMLVRVEIYLLPDGTWQVVRITALDEFTGIPGCMNLTATVVSFDGNRLQLLGWPELVLGEDVEQCQLVPLARTGALQPVMVVRHSQLRSWLGWLAELADG